MLHGSLPNHLDTDADGYDGSDDTNSSSKYFHLMRISYKSFELCCVLNTNTQHIHNMLCHPKICLICLSRLCTRLIEDDATQKEASRKLFFSSLWYFAVCVCISLTDVKLAFSSSLNILIEESVGGKFGFMDGLWVDFEDIKKYEKDLFLSVT